MSIDWNKYYKTFPQRYIEWNPFDNFVSHYVDKYGPKDALDVGGGVYGTSALSPIIPTLLDPYVDPRRPWWFREVISWGDLHETYDLIVCRGSINYLTPQQIQLLAFSGDNIIANTFNPSLGMKYRKYESLSSSGLEISITREDLVHHALIDDHMNVLYHTFNAYSPRDYKDILPGVEIYTYNKSLLLATGKASELARNSSIVKYKE